jgi:Acetyltransferase (GNAT) domain
VRDTPVAYIIGYRIRDVFYLEITGYDADWKAWAVGNTCILLSLQSMISENPPLRRYDFLSYEFEYKRRFGNNKWLEANFYVFPVELRLGVIYVVLKSNIIASNILRRVYNWHRHRGGPPGAVTTSAGTTPSAAVVGGSAGS